MPKCWPPGSSAAQNDGLKPVIDIRAWLFPGWRKINIPLISLRLVPDMTNYPQIFCALALLVAEAIYAQTPVEFRGADLKLGEKLIAEGKCAACHQTKVPGDGTAIYRPAGRINTAGLLRGMVEQCNTELNMSLFPDEVTAIAAVLNRDHYRFK